MKFILVASLVVSQAAHAVTFKHHASTETEIHVSLCESHMRDVFKKLDIDADAPNDREVSYSDTNDRRYLPQGLTVRTRDEKTTVKIKVESLQAIPPSWFSHDDFKCEQDRSGGTLNLNCSLDSKNGLTREQINLARLAVRDFDADDLTEFGPAEDSVWKDYETEIGDVNFERYRFADGDEFLELSTRVEESEQAHTYARLENYLATHSVRVCAVQLSKTKSFFAHF